MSIPLFALTVLFICTPNTVNSIVFPLRKHSPILPLPTSETEAASDPLTTTGSSYSIAINVGSPPARLQLLFDTGSADLGISSSNCSYCGRPDGGYNVSLSQTAAFVGCHNRTVSCPSCSADGYCQYTAAFVDGSHFTTQVVTDLATLGNNQPFPVIFGDIFTANRKWHRVYPHFDGIMGVGLQALSRIKARPVFHEYTSTYNLPYLFSIHVNGDGEGGVVSVGEKLATQAGTDSTADVQPGNFYDVHVASISARGTSLGPAYRALLDSGTSILKLPKAAFAQFKETVFGIRNLACNSSRSACHYLFKGECTRPIPWSLFPSIELRIGSSSNPPVYIHPHAYIRSELCYKGYYSLFVRGTSGANILGAPFFIGNVVTFQPGERKVSFGTPST